MSHERVHRHQSDFLPCIPRDYIPIQETIDGPIYGVISYKDDTFSVQYEFTQPAFGGYASDEENIYGDPTYCPNATRLHKLHKKELGRMPHLVFFDSEETAKAAGFRACQKCLAKKKD